MKLSEREFLLERLYNSRKINAYIFDREDHLIARCDRENPLSREEGMGSPELSGWLARIRQHERIRTGPVVLPEEDGIYHMAFLDAEENLYLFGPAAVDTMSFGQLVTYRKSHGILNQKFQIPRVTFSKGMNLLSMAYYLFTGRSIPEEEIMLKNNLAETDGSPAQLGAREIRIYEIQQSTEEKRRLTYSDELKWTTAIENGEPFPSRRIDREGLEKMEMVGTLSNNNAFKQYEYMAITSAALACRAAIRGGVNAYDAYLAADVYFQKISLCTNVMELLQLTVEIPEEFSRQVREAKARRTPDLVEQCKDYIARHRTRKFSLKELAAELGRNPSYLSRIFSEHTGRTLQDYALQKRLEAGANLLKFSDRTVGEIAEYLHFSSQSYFGEYFKRQYGQSPMEYRRNHKIRDFKE